MIGSDISEAMITLAKKNVDLLTRSGMNRRKEEISELYRLYGKESHQEAFRSACNLESNMKKEIPSTIYLADCTKNLEIGLIPDIIITDVPYGQLVEWQGEGVVDITQLAENLYEASREGTVLALVMDKKQKLSSTRWNCVAV